MAKKMYCFRLTDYTLSIIESHQAQLTKERMKVINRTEALEHIILNFNAQSQSVGQRIKHIFQADTKTKTLEGFIHAQDTQMV